MSTCTESKTGELDTDGVRALIHGDRLPESAPSHMWTATYFGDGLLRAGCTISSRPIKAALRVCPSRLGPKKSNCWHDTGLDAPDGDYDSQGDGVRHEVLEHGLGRYNSIFLSLARP